METALKHCCPPILKRLPAGANHERFHLHVSVDELESNIRFHSTIFGTQPSVPKNDYAWWVLEDPRVNFAISKRGAKPDLDHLGVQVESSDELTALREQGRAAEIAALDQDNVACCYARSNQRVARG